MKVKRTKMYTNKVVILVLLGVVAVESARDYDYRPPAPRPRSQPSPPQMPSPSIPSPLLPGQRSVAPLSSQASKYDDVLTTLTNAIEAANASNRLALELFRSTSSRGNIFIAPFSISTVLSMIYQGAAGRTAEELAEVMGYGNHTKNLRSFLLDGFKSIRTLIQEEKGAQNELIDVNAVLVHATVKLLPGLEQKFKEYYGASIETVNFQRAESLKLLDTLVELKTRGHIKKSFGGKEVDPNTMMILANVIYFKGVWEKKFNPKDTFKDAFLNEGLQAYAKQTDFMAITDYFHYTYYPPLKVSAVDLPYTGYHLSMTVLLPDSPSSLGQLEEKLQVEDIQQMVLDMEPTQCEIHLPRFKISTQLDLRKDLYKMGVKKAFSEYEAEFPYFTGDDSLYVNEFVHQTVVEVNEQGTVAAAVTAAAHGTRSKIVSFHVKHPFLFLIRDLRTGLVLFFGKVATI